LPSGYKPTVDQEPLTKLLIQDLSKLRERALHSFRRLESAVEQLTHAVRTGNPIVTPEENREQMK
jgi:hypothetical protein